MTPAMLAQAAQDLVGVPWRLHGRDPQHGLDCIGLLAAALGHAGPPVLLPTGYPLRLARLDGWLPDPASLGFTPAAGPVRPGDVLLIQPGPAQFHLAIAAPQPPGGWLHAHAGVRRVVHTPDLPPGSRCGHWRLIPD
jgi:hypothetical protein